MPHAEPAGEPLGAERFRDIVVVVILSITAVLIALDSYQPPGQEEAAADARADVLFQTALRNNQRGDDYTLLTVLFALVLFFTSVSGRPKLAAMRWFMLGLATTSLVLGGGFLAAFPKIV